MRRGTRHQVTVHLPFTDHRAMAAYWGAQALRSIRDAVARPPFPTEDLDLQHAVRCTRMAAWHALKCRQPNRKDG